MKELSPGERPLLGSLLLAGVMAAAGLPGQTALGNPVPSAAPDPVAAQAAQKVTPAQARGPTATERETLQKLHDANQMEIEMGELAKRKGSSKAVRQFGAQLVADHTQADRKIDAYLRKRGSDLRSLATVAASPEHAVIGAKSAAEFDRAFALRMIADHTRVIELVEGARKETGDEDLRVIYDELLPTLQAHKRAAQDIVAAAARS
jgi:predicted outer membrane protein